MRTRVAIGGAALTVVLAALVVVVLAGGPVRVAGRGSAAPVHPADLCPAAGDDAARLVECAAADVDRTWTARIGKPVRLRVTVDPAPSAVHRTCRDFLRFGTAFYCPSDARAYVTAAAVSRDRREFGDRLPYALATIVAHEAGHRVQFAVAEPELTAEGDAASRRVEQQADCLAGVWAADAARRGLLDLPDFRSVYAREMQIVSALRPPRGGGLDDYDEVATHGTPAQRSAAFDRGTAGRDPLTACRLTRGR
ncbi:MAG: neutral zinc metallopeptidase [Mycobacteriales bacterium]